MRATAWEAVDVKPFRPPTSDRTGLRLDGVLTMRWEDVDLVDRLLLGRRGLSAGEEHSAGSRSPWSLTGRRPAAVHAR